MAHITTAELATALETDARTTRKFLRSPDSKVEQVGKGRRYSIEKREVQHLKKRFAKWVETNARPAQVDEVDEVDAEGTD